MPELPEIRAHAERLTARFAGSLLERFEPISFTALKSATPAPADAVGHRLEAVGQRGKYLLLGFGDRTFVVHLMQGGRLTPDPRAPGRPRGALARWQFDRGELLLTEAGKERRAGVWVVAGDPEFAEPLAALGPDADTVDTAGLLALAHDHPMRLHGFLRDQHVVAGIGRRLANEVCHRARRSPFAPTAKLTMDDARALTDAIGVCVEEGLASERSRAAMSASRDRPGRVHHRVGEPCPDCGDTIRAVTYTSYTVAYCPTCQTAGRILADNTTSKFLK